MGKIMINDINFSGGGPQIDDTTTSNSTTWSSNQTNTEITKVAHNSADEYDSTRTSSNKYNKGDLCIYQNTLYKCNADGGTYGPFDSSKWDATTVEDELALKQNSIDSSLSTTSDTIVGAINELKSGKQNILTVEDIAKGITFTNLSGITSVTVLGAKKYGKIVDLWLQPKFTRSTAGINYSCFVNFTNNNNRPAIIATSSAFQGSEFWFSNFQSDGRLLIREVKGGTGDYTPYLRFIYICS